MFFAINSKTKEKVNSITVEENPSYNFIEEELWYADPDEIESCSKEINIKTIIVKFRKGSEDIVNWNGTKYDVSPHFFIPNKEKLGINTIPESKEHKLAKNWIYNKIKQKKLILNYSSINKPYKYNNQINLFDLSVDFSKIGIEIPTSRIGDGMGRRADVICPFIIKHPILGKGIIFEIQFSKQKTKTKISRELDWSIRGYSISWLHQNDFSFITENIIELKKDCVDVDSFANLIKQNNKSFVRDLKLVVKDECRKIDEKINNFSEEKIDHEKEIQKIYSEFINKLNSREAILIKKIESLDNNPFKNIIEMYKQTLQDYFNGLETRFNDSFEIKMNELNYPFAIGECNKCKRGFMYKKTTKTGKRVYGCSNYPDCKHTIWIN